MNILFNNEKEAIRNFSTRANAITNSGIKIEENDRILFNAINEIAKKNFDEFYIIFNEEINLLEKALEKQGINPQEFSPLFTSVEKKTRERLEKEIIDYNFGCFRRRISEIVYGGQEIEKDDKNLFTTISKIKKQKLSDLEKHFLHVDICRLERVLEQRGINTQEFSPLFKNNEYLDPKQTILFNQSWLLTECNLQFPKKLEEIYLNYYGLCEIICNKILIDGLLDNKDKKLLSKEITVTKLNQDSLVKSHILKVFSIFQKTLAYIFKKYPNNIFSISDQWNLVTKKEAGKYKINENLLFNKLSQIDSGTILKINTISRLSFSFSGHALLVKKTDEDKFVFFDPNDGEFRGLSGKELVEKINKVLYAFSGTDILITKGSDYLQELKKRKLI